MRLGSPFSSSVDSGRPTIAHIRTTYFNLSENWLDTQVRHTPDYQPLVLSLRTANLGEHHSLLHYAVLERPRVEAWANRFIRKALTGYFPSHYVLIRLHRARIIHAHFGPEGYAALPLAKATGVPLVTTFYGFDASARPDQSPDWRNKYRRLFSEGTLFLAEGPALAEKLRLLGCPPEKIRVQHLGVELEKYPSRPRFPAPGKPLKVLIAGRITEKKGMPDAVRAVGEAVRSGADLMVTIVGDASDDERNQREKRQVLDLIASYGLRDRVALLGMRPLAELRKAYYDHHVFLSPSVTAKNGDSEGGAPVTIIEAAATGMAVVSTWHGDIPEVIEHGRSGLLAQEHDVRQLAAYLTELADDGERVRALGTAAAARMRLHYDAVRQGERLASIYDEIV